MKRKFLTTCFHIFTCLLFTLSILAIVYSIGRATGKPLSGLTMDPAETFHAVPYVGILSYLGIMLWAATFGVCLIGGLILRQQHCHPGRFLLATAMFSLLLTLDDALLFHEQIFPHYLHIPQSVVMVGYVVIMTAYLLAFFRLILTTEYILFVLALISLGISAGMDQLLGPSNLENVIEDCFKFTGIVFWFSYFLSTANEMIQKKPSLNHMT